MTTIFKNEKSPNEEQSFHSDIEVKRYPVGDVQILVDGRTHTLTANEAAELGRVLCASDPRIVRG